MKYMLENGNYASMILEKLPENPMFITQYEQRMIQELSVREQVFVLHTLMVLLGKDSDPYQLAKWFPNSPFQ